MKIFGAVQCSCGTHFENGVSSENRCWMGYWKMRCKNFYIGLVFLKTTKLLHIPHLLLDLLCTVRFTEVDTMGP